ncbi:MAG: PQQ-binding-like beta-propeller repeat protein [Thermoguttaceae bacterium]
MPIRYRVLGVFSIVFFLAGIAAAEDWTQLKYDCRHSGDVSGRQLRLPLGLVAAAELTDAVFTAPVVGGGRVYVVDGAGVAFCLDAATLRVVWRVPTRGGERNCNNVSSPALAGRYLHFGTMAGVYYVLDAASGKVVKEIACGEPIFSAPVVGKDRVYFATLGSRVYALEFDGRVCWQWDFVGEHLGFSGDRWSGAAWAGHLKGRVRLTEQFLCSRDIALDDRTVVLPAGGTLVWLEDLGPQAKIARLHLQYTATLGLSIGGDGTVYRQWHWLDNIGQVDFLRPGPAAPREVLRRTQAKVLDFDLGVEEILLAGKEGRQYVSGTRSDSRGGVLSFSSVSIRGQDIYRCRPEEGFGFCKHAVTGKPCRYEGCYPSIAAPILVGDKAVYGGLDGALYVVPLSASPCGPASEQGKGDEKAWSFRTTSGKAISAPAAVCDGRVYFGSEDGYLYVLGPGGHVPLPSRDLQLWKIRSPLRTPLASAQYDRFTSFRDWGNTNADDQTVRLPLKMQWIRRYEGTAKQFSSFGGGRMYTHTAEGQIFAVEQQSGRLLWRRYFPGVHICYTAPLYYQERVLVPQAGLRKSRLRCLDAATGNLLWEAPFSGSPSWNRQQPPVIHKNLAVYCFGTGRYDPEAPDAEKVSWLFGHQDIPSFPASHRPLLRAYDLKTGRTAWTKDFSSYGSGGDDAGVCLMNGRLYYSCFFGHTPRSPSGLPGSQGITAAIEPETGRILWLTTNYSVRGGSTISAKDGRLYLGGYNPLPGAKDCHVWCLDAKDGALVWQSEPVALAIHVPTIGPHFIFVHAQYKKSYLLDLATGKILAILDNEYKCTRLTLSGSTLIGTAMDVYDVSDIRHVRLLSSGPRLDPSECISGCVSNGRVFYTGPGGGLQACQLYGAAAASGEPPWPAGAAEGDRSMFSAIINSQTRAFWPKNGPVPGP